MKLHPLVLACCSILTAGAQAQGFPERPIQMVVPFGPGGTTDLMARLLQDEFGRALGTGVVVVNVAGAGGTIGMSQVARAQPDGYTIAMTTIGPQAIQPARRNTGYTPDSFEYICGTYDVPVLTMVPDDSPHRNIGDLLAWAKANPGRFNYGSSGIGTALHISMLQLLGHHGLQGVHVPYKSTGDMVVPLKSGQIAAFNETPAVATQHQLRPLLALSDSPVPGYERVPTAKSTGTPVRASVWGGVVAPKGLPGAVRAKLSAACASATGSTLYKARAQVANNPLVYRDGDAFAAFVAAQYTQLQKVVRDNDLVEK